jgi:hypothetical protein
MTVILLLPLTSAFAADCCAPSVLRYQCSFWVNADVDRTQTDHRPEITWLGGQRLRIKMFFSQSVSPLAQDFWEGWSDRQFPDGTVIWNLPGGGR